MNIESHSVLNIDRVIESITLPNGRSMDIGFTEFGDHVDQIKTYQEIDGTPWMEVWAECEGRREVMYRVAASQVVIKYRKDQTNPTPKPYKIGWFEELFYKLDDWWTERKASETDDPGHQ